MLLVDNAILHEPVEQIILLARVSASQCPILDPFVAMELAARRHGNTRPKPGVSPSDVNLANGVTSRHVLFHAPSYLSATYEVELEGAPS